jgi:hypothetical protein
VFPASFAATIEQAAGGAVADVVEWSGRGRRHSLKVCRAVTSARPAPPPAAADADAATDYGGIADEASDVRRAAGAGEQPAHDVRWAAAAGEQPAVRGAGLQPCQTGGAGLQQPAVRGAGLQPCQTPGPALQPRDVRLGSAGPHGDAQAEGGARLIGTLVHRLFEQADAAADADDAVLRERLRSLMHPVERAAVADPDGVFAAAIERFRAIAGRPAVRQLFRGGERLHEVPFALRREGEIVHGTIDTLVRDGGVVTVVELKTGGRSPGHERQLALYMEAAAALFPPPLRIEGVLVYPDDDLWRSSP